MSIDRITIFFLTDLITKLKWCRYAMDSVQHMLSILVNAKREMISSLGMEMRIKSLMSTLDYCMREIKVIEEAIKEMIK